MCFLPGDKLPPSPSLAQPWGHALPPQCTGVSLCRVCAGRPSVGGIWALDLPTWEGVRGGNCPRWGS